MERTKVKSSNIKSVGYDKLNRYLEVEFVNGSVYQYEDVPIAYYDDLLLANSVGGFFSKFVRNKFKFKLVEQISNNL